MFLIDKVYICIINCFCFMHREFFVARSIEKSFLNNDWTAVPSLNRKLDFVLSNLFFLEGMYDITLLNFPAQSMLLKSCLLEELCVLSKVDFPALQVPQEPCLLDASFGVTYRDFSALLVQLELCLLNESYGVTDRDFLLFWCSWNAVSSMHHSEWLKRFSCIARAAETLLARCVIVNN